MKSTTTPDYHFSPTLQDWTACDAKIRCRLDHMTQSEYAAHMSARQEEVTLLGSKLGEAEIAYIGAKTDLTVEQIQETLRELRREGSQLPAPTAAEIESFIEQERFKVENDPTLSKKEKREILKSLREAEKELEKNQKEITGGVFHAWKNGLLAALARVRKPIMVGALAGGLAFGLAACAPAANNNTTAPPEKNPADTVQVEECETDVVATGDVVNGEKASNSSGEYCTIQINPESSALVYDKNKVDPELYELGYTDAQLENVQKQAVKLTIEQLIDNPNRGESTEDMRAWVEAEGAKYMTPEVLEASLAPSDKLIASHDVYGGGYALTPPAVYDGGPRLSQVIVNVERISKRTAPRSGEETVPADDNEVEVRITITDTQRIDLDRYDQWKTDLYTTFGYPELAENIKDEAFNRDEASYYDSNKTFRLAYNKEDVVSGEELKVRGIAVDISDVISGVPHN